MAELRSVFIFLSPLLPNLSFKVPQSLQTTLLKIDGEECKKVLIYEYADPKS